MSCSACQHSIGSHDGLQCVRTNTPATERCLHFLYAPGTDSEEWRRACEARWVCKLPSLEARDEYLDGVRQKRGDVAADALQAEIKNQLGKR